MRNSLPTAKHCFTASYLNPLKAIDERVVFVGGIELDHLDPPKSGGFQTEVRREPYPGKSIGTAIGECRKHRAEWRN
ncbi:hypothetical protein [Xenorhabdus griffiniae]|uniref:hypothetical protein n=1 Tax=Xenorhabdus griffiniae TaxID=351672 RepID=UPI0023599CC4|nr:hypothetical protein [Xenorhabdus griffiniae]MDC9603520.1 hypothetical protein [Xenorhabdus griffiniae]